MDDFIFSFWSYLIIIISCIFCCNLRKIFRNCIKDRNIDPIIPTQNRRRGNIQQITLNQLNELVSGNSSIMITNMDRIIERSIIENNKMDIQLYTKTDTYKSHIKKECSICLENIIKNDDIRILPCFHIYHQNCVDSWLIKKPTCPNCCENISNNLNENSEINII